MKPNRSELMDLNRGTLHVRRWGDPESPTLFMLHGRLDMSATFQFLVDALEESWSVIAPDWRGYGQSSWHDSPYSVYDDVVDLDRLVAHYSPDQPARLVAHSYGGAVATVYAGSRPERVRQLISLEGFGPRQALIEEAPALVASWLDEMESPPDGRAHNDTATLARRLMIGNKRLSKEQAFFLAEHIHIPGADGSIRFAADPLRRVRSIPMSFQATELFQQFLRSITAPTLWVRAAESHYMRFVFRDDEAAYRERFECLVNGHEVKLQDAAHNMHHDQPRQLARIIEHFLVTESVTAKDEVPA